MFQSDYTMVIRGKVGNSQHFPTNLHILLDEAEKAEHAHIVSWCDQGQSFKIHDQEALVPLLAKYFRQTKFKSFLRQLQSYGFHRTTRGCDKGVVSHPYFVRGRRSLCFRMTRKPSGSAAASQMALSRQQLNSSEIPPRALPGNSILPIRKIHSAPMAGYQNTMLPNGTAFNDLSKLKNAAFDFNSCSVAAEVGANLLQSSNGFQVDKGFSYNPPTKRRASTTSLFYSRNQIPRNSNKIRRSSEPTILMTSEQRESLLKCAEINYRHGSSPPRMSPTNGFMLSIKESTSVPTEAPSQQQLSFQVQPQQQQEPMPLHGLQQQQPQHDQVHRVMQVPQNSQVHIQQLQYQQQPQPPQHSFCVQYSSGQDVQRHPQHVTYTKYEVEPQAPPQEPPQVDQGYSQMPQTEKVYSQQEVAEKIKKAREDMAKHFQQQLFSNKVQAQYCQQDSNGIQAQQVVSQEVEKPNEQHFNQGPPPSDVTCASSMAQPIKASSMYASVPSNNFELSFSTSEFTNTNKKGAKPAFPTPKAPTAFVASSSEAYNVSSFSVAISTPTLGRMPGMGNAMAPHPRVLTDAYNRSTAELRPINIENIQSSQHHTQEEEERPEPIQHTSTEATQCDSIDEGTVDFLLQNGSGGCDEWEMPTEEVAEGLNYYGFLNTPTNGENIAEVSSTESGCEPMHMPADSHYPPIRCSAGPQYSRQ